MSSEPVASSAELPAMGEAAWAGKRLLFLGHYPLDTLNSAPQVRISALRDALAARCRLTFLTGTREGRRAALWRLILGGGWREVDGVYVEAATSTAMEADLILLWLWHRRGIPVSLYVRDAYPLFTDYFDAKPLKHRLLKAAWHVSIAAYCRWARILYFPTTRLANCLTASDKRLLQPAGRLRPGAEQQQRHGVIYVGEVEAVSGVRTLLQAGDLLAGSRADFRMTIVCRTPEQLSDWRDRAWLTIVSASGEALSVHLLAAAVAVVPRPRNSYNDLCLPVKLLDYLAHGLPVVVTDCPETVDFVTAAGVGEVVADDPAAVAAGIACLLDEPQRYRRAADAAVAAVSGPHGWAQRAETILGDLFGSA